jgi:hypothetical protein
LDSQCAALKVNVLPSEPKRFSSQSQPGIDANKKNRSEWLRSRYQESLLFVEELNSASWILALKLSPFDAAVENGLQACQLAVCGNLGVCLNPALLVFFN